MRNLELVLKKAASVFKDACVVTEERPNKNTTKLENQEEAAERDNIVGTGQTINRLLVRSKMFRASKAQRA